MVKHLALALLLCTATTHAATELRGDRVEILGGRIAVEAEQRLSGSIFALGGEVEVAGEVREPIVVIFGKLRLSGRADDDVIAILSDVELDGATIEGDFVRVLGALDDRGSTVHGAYQNIGIGSGWWSGAQYLFLWLRLLHKLLVLGLLVAVVALFPRRVRVIAEEAPARYLEAVFVGMLGYLGFWLLAIALLPTVVGPFLLWLLFVVGKWLGIAGIFLAFGRALARRLGRDPSMLMAVLASFALYVLLTVAPTPLGFFGLLVGAVGRATFFVLFEAPAVGLLLLTRFGRQPRAAASMQRNPGSDAAPLPL